MFPTRLFVSFSVLLCLVRISPALCTDSTLHVYQLDAGQHAELDMHDSGLADFWLTDWSGRDSAEISWPDHACTEDSDGRADSTRLVVRAACSDTGVYVCAVVRSDEALCPGDGSSGVADKLLIMLDTLAPARLAGASPEIEWYNGDAFTKLSTVLMTGVDPLCSLDTELVYNNYANWVFMSSSYIVTRVPYAETEETLGGVVVDRISLDDHTHAVEAFIPWRMLGFRTVNGSGGLDGRLNGGRELSLALEFADADTRVEPNQASMAWRCASPFAGSNGGDVPEEAIRAWGSLILADTITIASSPYALAANPAAPAVRRTMDAKHGIETYDLRGRPLHPSHRPCAGVYLHERHGRVLTDVIRRSRGALGGAEP